MRHGLGDLRSGALPLEPTRNGPIGARLRVFPRLHASRAPSTLPPVIKGRVGVRFLSFLVVLLVLTLVGLYVVGDRQQPQQRVIEQEVELRARQ